MPTRVRSSPTGIYWACVVGIVAWALVRAQGIDTHVPPIHLGAFLSVLTLAAVNLGIRNWASLRRDSGGIARTVYHTLGWLFVTIDLACIAAGLRFSGGLHSAIWVVAFVVLAGETLLENRIEATITRSGACLALFLGTIPTPPELIDWPAYLLELFVRMGLLLAVSSVVRRLRERSEAIRNELSQVRAELAMADQRTALAREIHDGVGNSLAASVLRLELTARKRDKAIAGDEGAAILREEAQVLREVMQQVRDWTFFNRPWSPDVSLASEVERLSQRTGLSMVVTGAESLTGLDEPLRLTVLRVAQEGLTNAAKHASGANHATVRVTRDETQLRLTIEDDGSGFDLSKAGPGVGLMSMRERAKALSGELQIESGVGAGTKIFLRLPLH